MKKHSFIQAVLLAAAILMVLGFAPCAEALIINPMGYRSTADFTQGLQAGRTARGWDFQVNADNLEVVQLGVSAAAPVDITLSLWDFSTREILGQTIVKAGEGRAWAFGMLDTPVRLALNGTYSVIGWANTENGVPWYLYDNHNPPLQANPSGDIEYLRTRFGNDIDANQFAAGELYFPFQYGLVDIGYQAVVPEPATFLLLGAGLAGVALVRRRIKG